MENENVCEACGEGFDEGTLNVVGQLTCEPCLVVQREEYEDEAKRAVPAPKAALQQTLDAMEREEFHLDDLLDALSAEIEEGAKKGNVSGRSCFLRALLDRLDDGDLAVELAFRLGEIGDPFPQR